MLLEGSCHCKSVVFSIQSTHPYPFNRCYCQLCRKTAGGGGYAVNLGAEFDSLRLTGEASVSTYQAKSTDPDTGQVTKNQSIRHFCKHCGSALWIYDERWPELIHPFASAIDTELPVPPNKTHMMLSYKANWVQIEAGPQDQQFVEYPQQSLAQWHRAMGLEETED